jgi:AhpD family alkylhydroperoxidase
MAGETIFSEKERAIINLATSLASGCWPCMKYHLRISKKSGLCDDEIMEIFDLTDDICTHAFRIMKLRSLELFKGKPIKETGFHLSCHNRRIVLVGLALSYAVNSTALTNRYLACARKLEISESEISGVIDLSKFTWGRARAHVEILLEGRGVEDQVTGQEDCNCGCGC